MNQSLDFGFKSGPLLELDESIGIGDGEIDALVQSFFSKEQTQSEIFITEVQNETEEFISHEITEPNGVLTSSINEEYKIPEYSLGNRSEHKNTKKLYWVNGNLNLVDETDIMKKAILPLKSYICFPNYADVDPFQSSPVYWKEGNISQVKSFCKIPQEIVNKYYEYSDKNRKKLVKTSTLSKNNKMYLSWEAVKNRVEEIEEQSHTKFVTWYKQESFHKLKKPVLTRRLCYELEPYDKGFDVRIPFTGVPIMFVGKCTLSCHLGQRHYKLKTREDGNMKGLSKKMGCPAKFDMIRIIRFPDYDISCLKVEARETVCTELMEAISIKEDSVRFYFEYYIKEPQLTDHKFHEMVSSDKEPPDPRFQSKLDDLIKRGVHSSLISKGLLQKSLRDEFGDTSLKRRRYNPTNRDIRYMKDKALKKFENEVMLKTKTQCNELMSQIEQLGDDTQLSELKNQLQTMRDSILFARTNDVILEDGINLVLENVTDNPQIEDTSQILLTDPITDNNSIYIDGEVWNPINFVNVNDRPTESMIFSRDNGFEEGLLKYEG